MTVLESSLERFFVEEGKRRRVWVLKSETLITGFPDRMCLGWPARIAFAELKQEGEKPTPIQWARLRLLRRLGFQADPVTTRAEVLVFYDKMGTE